MKKYLLIPFSILFICNLSFAQAWKTDSIKVSGNCQMCKDRIEESLYISGIKNAKWSPETKMLNYSYKPKKISKNQIKEKVAAVGHDAENYPGNQEAYATLPDCCKYREKSCTH